jgi:diguanylate cyclase (GGDEF)-like protein/PAS domain S-box-containing protein
MPASQRIPLLYLLLATAWIWGSDRLAEQLFGNTAFASQAQSWKGTLFVVVTAVILFLLVRQDERTQARTREALDVRQHRLDTFIEHAPAALALLDRDMRYLLASRRWIADYGLDAANLIGRSHYEVFPSLPEHWKAAHRRAFEGEVSRCEEETFVLPDGTEAWLRWEVRPGETLQGRIESIVVFTEDITGRKRDELRLREAEQRWKFAIDGSDLGLWDWNVTAGTVFFSSNWKAMLGFADDEIGNDLSEWKSRVHPDDLDKVMEDVGAHLAGRTASYVNEHRVRCRDGRWKWILDRGKVVERAADGSASRMIGTHTDLTPLKQREEALALNADVFRNTSEGIVICDADNRIVSVNHAFTEITGYAAHEVLGRNPGLLSSGRHDRAFYRDMWARISASGNWQGEVWNRRRDGDLYLAWLTINVARDREGRVRHYHAIFSDITQRRQTEARISHMTHHDALTDLPNRVLLRDRIALAIRHAERDPGMLAVLFLDLDRFKNVNDSLGHRVGDALLVEVARRICATVRHQDTVSRAGGDEFSLLLPDTDAEGAAHVAQKLLDAIGRPFQVDGHELTPTPSIGIAIFPADGQDVDALLRASDAAMYRAKASGGGVFRFYAPELHRKASRALELENALRGALDRDELELHYQPQVLLGTGRLIGCEALLRWHHPKLGTVSPAEFVPVAEESGLILPIGEWVVRTAAVQNRRWQDSGFPPIVIAANVSAVQFRQTDFGDVIDRILTESGLEARGLELELTESVMSADPEAAIRVMDGLHARGVALAIDDFGTGYSSLAYLKRFSINRLKIDRSFVHDLGRDPSSEAIVEGVIAMARSLGLRTIAEGVETDAQASALASRGCDEAQGFLYGRPMPAVEFERWRRETGR